MSSLDVTFEILKQNTSPCAGEVLQLGAASDDRSTRQRCLHAMAHRKDVKTLNWLINRFEKCHDDLLSALTTSKVEIDAGCLGSVVTKQLAKGGWNQSVGLRLIEMIDCLNQTAALETLIHLAQHHEDSLIRAASGEVTLSLVCPLSKPIRQRAPEHRIYPESERFRQRITEQLAAAVERHNAHRNNDLLDAFLVISDWNDALLQRLLSDESSTQETLLRRMRTSEHQAVLQLLSGFIRRRKVSGPMVGLILRRHDAMFCEALLDAIGESPTPVTSINLREYGLPDCLRGGESFMRSLGSDRDAAMCNAYSIAMPHESESVHMVLAMLERGGEHSVRVAEVCLKRIEAPSLADWIADLQAASEQQAALDQATANSQAYQRVPEIDRQIDLLNGLVELSDHDSPSLAQAAQALLVHLNTHEALPIFAGLTPDVGRRLGRILMQVDSSTLDVIRHGLRHAVMQNRLDAIAFTESLGLIDLMIDPLRTIAETDHQVAKLRAAQALAHGTGTQSETVLRELCAVPTGSLRDAAFAAMKERGLVA
ncbi:hypothetical protein RISK_006686 [Rhodopirellula islandica]|uniref:Uncharacterized protein n=1 Tax=Rhodopirellula islandica TaxID=595434 RepID=A0A0J1B2W2_RHOIS|nr:hypothetical protein [Rhodopirellula islandica]KLU01117.1 hypothetical protein RISK_006686 [Rhodopirellula islandica]